MTLPLKCPSAQDNGCFCFTFCTLPSIPERMICVRLDWRGPLSLQGPIIVQQDKTIQLDQTTLPSLRAVEIFSSSLLFLLCSLSFRFFTFSSRWHLSARKGPYALRPVSQQSTRGCPRNSTNICLVEHRSFSTLEGGMSAASFLHSSFLQAVNAVMLWLVRVEKVPQASEHLCPSKLQTRCDICCACQSICLFIPTDSGVSRTVDPQKSV